VPHHATRSCSLRLNNALDLLFPGIHQIQLPGHVAHMAKDEIGRLVPGIGAGSFFTCHYDALSTAIALCSVRRFRPMSTYSKPAERTASGSSRLRPSMIIGTSMRSCK